MAIATKVSGDIVTISVEGSFDVSAYEEFKAAYQAHMTPVSRFIIDLGQASYMDSSALGMLLLLREQTGGDRQRLELVNVKDEVRNILNIAQFNQLFTVKS